MFIGAFGCFCAGDFVIVAYLYLFCIFYIVFRWCVVGVCALLAQTYINVCSFSHEFTFPVVDVGICYFIGVRDLIFVVYMNQVKYP